MNAAVILHVWRTPVENPRPLAEVMPTMSEDWKNARPVALLYTPDSCVLGRLDGNNMLGWDGQPIALAPVFEARVFCLGAELRWLHVQGGKGQSVFLSESDEGPNGWAQLNSVNAITTGVNRYLVWGETLKSNGQNSGGVPKSKGWSLLGDARIGKLMVPVADVADNERVYLESREYFGCAPDEPGAHGNIVVLEERLMQLLNCEAPVPPMGSGGEASE